MNTIALVAALAFSPAFVGKEDDSNPLVMHSTCTSKGNQTTYTVHFFNSSKYPIEGMKIRKVGVPIHYKLFKPDLTIPTIGRGKKYTLKVDLKGAIFGADLTDLVSVEGSFRNGKHKHFLALIQPKDCWPTIKYGEPNP